MAAKTALFLLAFVLLVTRMGLSVEDVDNIGTEHRRAKAPEKAPVHAPAKAPVYSPAKAPVHSPAKAPVHAPEKAPVYPPVSHPHGCVAMCASYCRPVRPRRACMKACTACCAKCKCVPGFMKCEPWDKAEIHGRVVKCP